MKRSIHVSAPLLAAAALGVLTGCHHAEMQRCVDANNKVVDQSFCKSIPNNAPAYGSPGYMPGFFPYHYYYGGGGGYGIGSPVYGGYYTPMTGHSYSTTAGRASSSSSTTRGGFGSTLGGTSSSGAHGSSSSAGS